MSDGNKTVSEAFPADKVEYYFDSSQALAKVD